MRHPDQPPRWRRYLRLLRPNVRADVDDEIRFHLESRIDELVAHGHSVDSAHARACAEFGSVVDVRSDLVSIGRRVAAKHARIESLWAFAADVRYAVRSLARTPGVALAILLTLGLGVGANAAMFTLIDAIFLRPPAGVVDVNNVHRLWQTAVFRDGTSFWPGYSYLQYSAIVDAVGNRGTAAIYNPPRKTRVGSGEGVAEAQVSYANASYFALLGVRAEVGRIYSNDESGLDQPDHVVVLSHDYWMRAFEGKQSAIGATMVIASRKFTIVGVAGSSFTGVDLNAADLWMPLGIPSEGSSERVPWWRDKNDNGFSVLVRPAPGVFSSELEQRITPALRDRDVRYRAADSITVARFGSIVRANGPGDRSQEERITVRLAGVAIIVLLIACANVVNLLLSRAVRRRREIAVRLALGISRARLLRLLLVESGVLAIAAAGVAVVVAYAGGIELRKLLLPDIHWARSPLDWSVVLLALGVAAVAGLLAGLIPAVQSASPELTSALKAGAGAGIVQRSRLRTGLVIAQAALSVVLLVGAVLFVKSVENVRGVDIGFDARRIMMVTAIHDASSSTRDSTLPPRIGELAERIKALPGVENVGLSNMAPMSGFSSMTYFTDTDSSAMDTKWDPTVSAVSPGYFAATGIHIVRGTNFSAEGSGAPPEVIVNETMAKRVWAGRDPIGQCMRFVTQDAQCYRVAGVVEDSRMGKVLEEPMFKYYVSFANVPARSFKPYYVIVGADPRHIGDLTAATRALVQQDFPDAIPQITWLSDYIEPQYRPWQLGATLFTAFGVLALIVSVVGIYSTVSYGVNQRLHEFGVRIAIGAQVGDVLRLVVGDGLRTVAIGVGCGVVLALLAGRLIASLLYGVTPYDPGSIAVVAATLLLAGAAAALIPAWRASRVDPVTALRAD